jgi:PPE family
VRLPEIPAVTPPPTLPGDALAALIHDGPGSSGLREFADAWRAHADTLDELADHVLGRGAAIDEHWIDGHQRAGANTREHGYWLREGADQARTIAAGAAQVAEQFDTAQTATPTPEQFDGVRREFTAAQARRDPTGMAMAARQYAQMRAQAVNAAMAYHGGATSAANTLGTPLQTAPAIARGGPGIQMVDDKEDPGGGGGAGSIGSIEGGGGLGGEADPGELWASGSGRGAAVPAAKAGAVQASPAVPAAVPRRQTARPTRATPQEPRLTSSVTMSCRRIPPRHPTTRISARRLLRFKSNTTVLSRTADPRATRSQRRG